MSTSFWKVPAWEVPIDKAVRVDLFRLDGQTIIPEDGWTESFCNDVRDRRSFDGKEAQNIVRLFKGLSLGESARCHMPPWGLAFYDREGLLFTTTLCFECSNAYVYSEFGRNLRAFDVTEFHARELFAILQRELPL
ncbi:hypothetical protein [Pseudanabaena sp. 'Roaring Creek']|uniref:hypothetical protein n=1 Tax=Pseudanabaena sp. 'Roaring Creek' TaxID=1681830 RepID=UPI0006D7C18C|nr:hypothetical protein [Pseudanabaena sp. 'Roaring Creek']